MTVFRVKVKSTFYVEADKLHEAKTIVNKAVSKLPNFEFNISRTKMNNTGLNFETLSNPKVEQTS